MERSPYDLCVIPMEDRRSLSENTHYTLRTPMRVLKNPSDNFFRTVKSTAQVAFHNKRGAVIFHSPLANIPQLIRASSTLTDIAQTQFQDIKDKELVPTETIKTVSWDCVDRRMDDKGASPTEGTAQITHPGGLLMLDPELSGSVPEYIIQYLEDEVLKVLADKSIKISEISAHFGAGEVPGCGGVNLLKNSSARAKNSLSTPADIRDALDRVRSRLSIVMAPDCRLMGDVIFPDGGVIRFRMDNRNDFTDMMESGRLNI